MKLINLSNHVSSKWSEAQKAGFSEIVDIQFPNIPATATTEDVKQIAKAITTKICELDAFDIMLQGEFTLCYLIQREILQNNLNTKFWIPTTERKVAESITADGTATKTAIFEFVQWRTI